MLIDWFTVVAQIINFLILVMLLKYFLYDRIIKAMDQREEKIAARLEDAKKQKKDAAQEAEALRVKNEEFEQQRQEMTSKAKEEAENRRKELVQHARQEVDDLKAKWEDAVRKEEESFVRGLQEMAREEVYAIARRALADLAGADVEDRAIRIFLSRIRELSDDEKHIVAESIRSGQNGLLVRSGFEIPPAMRDEITKALNEHVTSGIQAQFETAPELIFGVELKTRHQKIAWSLDDYLQTLEERARDAIERQGRREPATPDKTSRSQPEHIDPSPTPEEPS